MIKKLFAITILASLFASAAHAASTRPAYMRDSTALATREALDENIGKANVIPIGTIIIWNRQAMPEDGEWLECNGQPVPADCTDYIKIFGFRTPDYRGVFLRGYKAQGYSIGNPVYSTQGLGKFEKSNMGEHRHVVGKVSNQWGYYSGGYGSYIPSWGHQATHDWTWDGWESAQHMLSGKAIPYDEASKKPLSQAKKEQAPANVAVKYIIKVR